MGFNDLLNGLGNFVNECAESIDEGAAIGAAIGRSMYSNEGLVNKAKYEYIRCKKKCNLIMFLVLVVCGVIIYFHVRG